MSQAVGTPCTCTTAPETGKGPVQTFLRRRLVASVSTKQCHPTLILSASSSALSHRPPLALGYHGTLEGVRKHRPPVDDLLCPCC